MFGNEESLGVLGREFKIPKINIVDSINKTDPPSHRGKIKHALGLDKLKTSEAETTERKVYHKEILEELKHFDGDQFKRMKNYNEIKSENDNFSKKFNQAEKFNEHKKGKLSRGPTTTDNLFKDLIIKYQNKGYKDIDLSTNNNLFGQSPLLLENHKLEDFYKYLENKGPTEDNSNYLIKLNGMINEKMQSEELDQEIIKQKIVEKKNSILNNNKKENIKLVQSIYKNEFQENKSEQEILKEIEENQKYIENMRKMFRENKKLDDLKLKFTKDKSLSNINVLSKFSRLSLTNDISNFNNILGKDIEITKSQKKGIIELDKIKNNSNTNKSKTKRRFNNSISMSREMEILENSQINEYVINKEENSKNYHNKNYSQISDLNTNNQTLISRNDNSNSDGTLNPIRSTIINKSKTKLTKIALSADFYNLSGINKNVTDDLTEQTTINNTVNFNSINNSPINALNEKMRNVSPIPNINQSKTKIIKRGTINNSGNNKYFNMENLDFSNYIKDENMSERELYLDFAYHQINNLHDEFNVKESASIYAKKYLNYDDKSFKEVFGKKPEPIHILKSVQELKKKVENFKIPDILRLMYVGSKKNESGMAALSKISELDKLIRRLDLDLAKKLNKKS